MFKDVPSRINRMKMSHVFVAELIGYLVSDKQPHFSSAPNRFV